MICPHCAASISGKEEKCPYCDSFLEHKEENKIDIEALQENLNKVRDEFIDNPDDKPNIFMIIISMFMPIGILMFVLNLIKARPKSAIACLITGILTTFILGFCYVLWSFIEFHF